MANDGHKVVQCFFDCCLKGVLFSLHCIEHGLQGLLLLRVTLEHDVHFEHKYIDRGVGDIMCESYFLRLCKDGLLSFDYTIFKASDCLSHCVKRQCDSGELEL